MTALPSPAITPVSDRQTLLLALCELIALVSGLILSTPFDFVPACCMG